MHSRGFSNREQPFTGNIPRRHILSPTQQQPPIRLATRKPRIRTNSSNLSTPWERIRKRIPKPLNNLSTIKPTRKHSPPTSSRRRLHHQEDSIRNRRPVKSPTRNIHNPLVRSRLALSRLPPAHRRSSDRVTKVVSCRDRLQHSLHSATTTPRTDRRIAGEVDTEEVTEEEIVGGGLDRVSVDRRTTAIALRITNRQTTIIANRIDRIGTTTRGILLLDRLVVDIEDREEMDSMDGIRIRDRTLLLSFAAGVDHRRMHRLVRVRRLVLAVIEEDAEGEGDRCRDCRRFREAFQEGVGEAGVMQESRVEEGELASTHHCRKDLEILARRLGILLLRAIGRRVRPLATRRIAKTIATRLLERRIPERREL